MQHPCIPAAALRSPVSYQSYTRTLLQYIIYIPYVAWRTLELESIPLPPINFQQLKGMRGIPAKALMTSASCCLSVGELNT